MWLFIVSSFSCVVFSPLRELSADVLCYEIPEKGGSRQSETALSREKQMKLEWIEKRFYRYLSDYLMEDLKLRRTQPSETFAGGWRIRIPNNIWILSPDTEELLMIPHYANYEWITGMGTVDSWVDVPIQVQTAERPLSRDRLFKRIRSRFGGYNILETFPPRVRLSGWNATERMAVGLITDFTVTAATINTGLAFWDERRLFWPERNGLVKMMNFPFFIAESKHAEAIVKWNLSWWRRSRRRRQTVKSPRRLLVVSEQIGLSRTGLLALVAQTLKASQAECR